MASSRAPEPDTGAHFALVADRDFGPYLVGNLVSNCGTWFQNLAQAILVYRLTGSVFLLGVVNFAQFAGVFLLAPLAGSAADRFDRRRLLLATQVAAFAISVVLAIVTFAGAATAALVIVLALLIGATAAFANPAMQALVPALVDRERLPTAIALHSATFSVARALGPAGAALVIAHLGVGAAFALNSVSYLFFAAALAIVRPRPLPSYERTGWRESIAFVRRDRVLVALLVLLAAASLAYDPVPTLTPAFAAELFAKPDTVSGYMIGAFGVGALVAVPLIARPRFHTRRPLGVWAGLLGLGIAGFAASPSVPVAVVALVVAGFGYLAVIAAATTRLQTAVDESRRGKVMAIWTAAFLGTRPLGSLADGVIAATAGLRAAGFAMSALALVPAALLLGGGRRLTRS